MKKMLLAILKFLSKKILKKHRPQIVGITGSVGKTSTTEAIFTVLSAKFSVRKSMKNYNNEFGVPLTIIGSVSGNRSLVRWLGILLKGFRLSLVRDSFYPQILVLEMGADRKGDIQYLVNMAHPYVGVITSISESHLEYFGTLNAIIKEKADLIRYLEKEEYAVLNMDEETVQKASKQTEASVLSFGFSEKRDMSALEMNVSGVTYDHTTDVSKIRGVSFKISYNGSSVPVFLPSVLGKQHVYSALAAASVGVIFKMNLIEISEALKRYDPPNGRMNVIAGVKKTLIIDDTYNSSPASSVNALETVAGIAIAKGAQRFAVLGDMLELGSFSAKAHKEIGALVHILRYDYLIAVGERASDMARGARDAGMKEERVYSFSNSVEAGKFVQERMEEGDVLLVKGSQGVRMERIVKEIMAEPLRAEELLVRHDAYWLKR